PLPPRRSLFHLMSGSCFFLQQAASTELSALSLHDALPISGILAKQIEGGSITIGNMRITHKPDVYAAGRNRIESMQNHFSRTERSEEHTSELQSREHLVCRLLLEKKKVDTKSPPLIALRYM